MDRLLSAVREYDTYESSRELRTMFSFQVTGLLDANREHTLVLPMPMDLRLHLPGLSGHASSLLVRCPVEHESQPRTKEATDTSQHKGLEQHTDACTTPIAM